MTARLNAVVVLDGPRSLGLGRALGPAAAAAGVRLITPLRPAGIAFDEWPALHAQLLDEAGVERAGIVAQSGGTPWALAAALMLPERTTAVAFLGPVYEPWLRGARKGLSPDWRTTFFLGRHAPGLLERVVAASAKDPAKAAARVVKQAPEADREVLVEPDMLAIHESESERILADPADFAAQAAQIARPWGIDVQRLACPAACWSGELDRTHPTGMARRLAAALGGVEVHVVPGAGTFALRAVYPEVLAFCR